MAFSAKYKLNKIIIQSQIGLEITLFLVRALTVKTDPIKKTENLMQCAVFA